MASVAMRRSIGGRPGGRVIFAPNLEWKDVGLKKPLEKELKAPVFLENDCNVCALGVYETELKRKPKHMAGIFLGTGIGAIPGTGGAIASFLAYDHAKRFSKKPEKFGKGNIEGVIAPETANNAVTGGTLIPLLSLGIPGDPATAIVLAGLMIHGITPGPALFMNHASEVYGIYVAVVLAYVWVLGLQLMGIRIFVHVLKIPRDMLAIAVLVLCAIGAYSIRNSAFDIYAMGVIGVLAYVLIAIRVPITPIILGMVLGPTLENEFRTAMMLSSGSADIFLTSPTALVFFALAALVIGLQLKSELSRKKQPQEKIETSDA